MAVIFVLGKCHKTQRRRKLETESNDNMISFYQKLSKEQEVCVSA